MNKTISEGPLEGAESAAVYKSVTPGQENADNVPYKSEDEIVNDDIKKMIAAVSDRIMCMGLKESIRKYGTDWRTISKFLATYEEDGIDKLVEHLEALNNIKGKPLRAIVEHVEMDEVNPDELMESVAAKKHKKYEETFKIGKVDVGNYSTKVTVHGKNGVSTHEIDHGDGGYSFNPKTVYGDLNHNELFKSGISKDDHQKVANSIHAAVKKKAYLGEAYAYKDKDGKWPKLAGEFAHKETNKFFEYAKETDDPWAKQHGLTHKVWMTNGEYRFAKIKGTVAYVAVDENPDGSPKMEKWLLKKHRTFKESAGLDEDFSKALGE